MERLLATGDVRDLKGVQLCAVGPSTGARLQRYGLRVDLMPAEYRAEAVLEALSAAAGLNGQRILLPRADIARELLGDELREAGAEVTEVVAYRTLPGGAGARRRPRHLPDAARSADRRRHVHERVGRQELRRDARPRAGRRPAADDGRRVDWSGHRRSGAAARHRDDRDARALHDSRSRRRARRALQRSHHGPETWPRKPRTTYRQDPDRGARTSDSADFPRHRPRRLRRTPALRALVRETRLSPEMFIYPLFVCTGEGQRREVGLDAGRVSALGRRSRPRGGGREGRRRPGRAAVRPAGREGRRRLGRLRSGRRRCRRRCARSSARCPACWS